MDNKQEVLRFLDILPYHFEITEPLLQTIVFDDSYNGQIYSLELESKEYCVVIKKNIHIFLTLSIKNQETSHIKLICHIEENASLTINSILIETPFVAFFFEGILYKKSSLNAIFKIRLTNNEKFFLSTRQTHIDESGKSILKVKGLLQQNARLWCENITTMHKTAGLSHTEQITHALLLSKKARIQTMPALEVLNHTVHCKHGSAIAYIEEEHRFYIMSRGVSKEKSEELIIEGFIG